MSIIGIDPAAQQLGVAVVTNAGKVVSSQLVSNTKKGWSTVARLAAAHDARVGIEGITGWGLAVALYLIDQGVRCCGVEPWQVAQLRGGVPIHRKDDRTDAEWTARAVSMWDPPDMVLDRNLIDLGVYLNHHETNVTAQKRRASQVHSFLGRVDPTYQQQLGRLRSRRQWKALCDYDHPRFMLGSATIRALATEALDAWTHLRLDETILEGLLPPLGQLLCDRYDGIGPVRAAQILVHTGNPHRFRSDNAYAAFCGLAPVEHSSGKHNSRHLSRGGNRQLHAVFTGAINTQISSNKAAKAYVTRRVDEGTPRPIAKIAVARKLLRSVYRTLTSNQNLT